MPEKNDNAGILIPPPLFFIAVYFAALLIQRFLPVDNRFFHTTASTIIGLLLIFLGLIFSFPALLRFLRSRNTVITHKPARSLQTSGIYSVSRNPMYVGLMLFYTGIALYAGNWWHLVLLPVLFFIVQEYIIKREEKYLYRRFGQTYLDYKARVRRWI